MTTTTPTDWAGLYTAARHADHRERVARTNGIRATGEDDLYMARLADEAARAWRALADEAHSQGLTLGEAIEAARPQQHAGGEL